MADSAPQLIEALPEDQQKTLREEWEQAGGDSKRRRIVFVQTRALWQAANPGKRVPLADDALEQLRSQLSPDAREWLDEMPADRRRRFLGGLIGAFLFIHSQEELSEYLQKEATAGEREFLTSLPPAEMRQQLWWRYLHWKWPEVFPGPPEHRRGRGPPRGPFSPGPDGPPGPHRRFDRGQRPPPPGSGERVAPEKRVLTIKPSPPQPGDRPEGTPEKTQEGHGPPPE
jgi:hypothetical protein